MKNHTATVTSKGQMTIPAWIVRRLKIQRGDKIEVSVPEADESRIHFRKLQPGEQPPFGPATRRLGAAGQITLPATLRQKLGLTPRDPVTVTETASGVLVTPRKVSTLP